MKWSVLQGDARAVLRGMPAESVHVCVTSPPYWGLRTYGGEPQAFGGDPACTHGWLDLAKKASAGSTCAKCGCWLGHLGLEPLPGMYVEHVVEIMRDVRRVLRRDGLLFLNLGDSYAAGAAGAAGYRGDNAGRHRDGKRRDHRPKSQVPAGIPTYQPNRMPLPGLKPKDLVGIPWMVAFALRDDGWYLRRDLIWDKSANCMPESIQDRAVSAHEYIFHLSKAGRYFYDAHAVREPSASGPSDVRKMEQSLGRIGGKHVGLDDPLSKASAATNIGRKRAVGDPSGRALRSVLHINTAPNTEAHFASFPPKLVEVLVKAATSDRGCCPTCGAQWLRVVEREADNAGYPNGPGGTKKFDVQKPAGFGGSIPVRGVSTLDTVARYSARTVGWRPGCGCYFGMESDDLEEVASPTGGRSGPDPTMAVGRRGLARQRSGGGRATSSRWRQRAYAEQLAASPNRAEMEAEAGTTAFAHYLRTDRAGARPAPARLLRTWLERGWLKEAVRPGTWPEDAPKGDEAAAGRVAAERRHLLEEWKALPAVPAVVFDPFAGSGTAGMVAIAMQRDFVGIDLSAEYCEMARRRIGVVAPLLAQEVS